MPSLAAKSRPSGPGALDLLEEAVHALRQASAGTLAWYYLATLPFLLGLLFFCADLSRDPGAADYSAGAALGLALLFLVMKTGQSIFAARLRAGLGTQRAAPAPWTLRRVGRVALVQAVLQPSGLVLLPVAAVLTLPLGWACAFYGHANALADDAAGSPGRACARAAQEALRWPRQNHLALLVMSFLGFFVWVNVLAACALFPHLLKMFSGEQNAFTRAGFYLFNSTFFAATGALVYLLLDPLWKAFYALRAFHVDAQSTGEDLQRALQMLPDGGSGFRASRPRPRAAIVAAGLLGLALLWVPSPGVTAPAAPPSAAVISPTPAARVPPAELNRSIDDVLARREFAWRERRQAQADDPNKSWLRRFGRWLEATVDGWRRWWRKVFPQRRAETGEPPGSSGASLSFLALKPLAYTFGAILLLATLFYLVKAALDARRTRRAQAGLAAPAGGNPPAADLTDENLLATQLPEDEWLRLARELLARGERRLALRAFYLSTLALLAGRGLVGIARHKTNGDYLGEVRRRAAAVGSLPMTFERVVRGFERTWYGRHEAGEEAVAALLQDRQMIADGGALPPAEPAAPPPPLPAMSR